MVLKLETFVEIDTKEPSVVKQLLNEKLAESLRNCQIKLKRDCDSTAIEFRNNGIDFLWDADSQDLRRFMTLLWDNNVTVLTPDQVVERLRKGIKK